MSDQKPFGVEPAQTREQLFGLDDAAVERAGLTPGVADAAAEAVVRYEEAIAELAASR